MSELKKLNPEELQSIKDMQLSYNKIVMEIGSIDVELNELNEAKQTLMGLIKDLNKSEKEIIKTLEEKYGAGTIDITTGEITPIN